MAINDALQWADVINPDPAAAQRYAGLAPAIPIRWYSTVEASSWLVSDRP
jgi:hypothetical protein